MFDVNFIIYFAAGFAAGGLLVSSTFFLLFFPKMREFDKEFHDLRTENRELKRFLLVRGGSDG